MKEKILYMAGMGCDEYNHVNCRCESIFKDQGGKLIRASACGFPISTSQRKNYNLIYRRPAVAVPLSLELSVFDSETKSWVAIVPDWRIKERRFPDKSVRYSTENICYWINAICGTEFDRVIVLPWDEYGGYYVMNDARTQYNRGDTFHYQPRITKRRQEKVAELTLLHQKQFGMKYDNTSYWVGDDKKLHMRFNVSDKKLLAAGYDKRDYIIEL